MNKLELNIAGETVELWADRALFWSRERTLFIADLHLGKANTFQKFGVPLADDTRSELKRLTGIMEGTACARVVFLGDFVHSELGTTKKLVHELGNWMANYGAIEFILIKGNHDRGFEHSTTGKHLSIFDTPERIGPFVCRHEPVSSDEGHVLCGHLHPSFILNDRNGTRLRCPCFWMRPTMTVLPAFGAFTGTEPIKPERGDRICVVGDGFARNIHI